VTRSRIPAVIAFLCATTIPGPSPAQVKIPVEGTDRHRIQYADSTISANDLCPVLQKGLGARKAPFYVNGQPIGFC
jgi:hypothetical protein